MGNAALDDLRARGFVAEVRTTLGPPAPRTLIPIAEHTEARERWERELGAVRAQNAALSAQNEQLHAEVTSLRAELARAQKPTGKRQCQ